MSIEQRAKTKEYIKNAFLGYVDESRGLRIPGARRIYKGLSSSEGFDLRHIERWTAAQLKTARNRAQSLNTLTSRNFTVLVPRTTKQRKQARTFTGQDLPHQKEFIVQVQDSKIDKAIFRNNKVTIERTLKGGEVKQIKQRYLFADYESKEPVTFRQMMKVTNKMLTDMPERYRGRAVYYTLTTAQYGPIGNPVMRKQIIDELAKYHERYESNVMHQRFAEQIIGYTMIGSEIQAGSYIIQSDQRKQTMRQRRKLRFRKNRS